MVSLQSLTRSQLEAVLHKDGPLLVIAGPGSGKTRVITNRIAALVDSGVKAGCICAITFTNKAAEQMRYRVESMAVCRGVHISTFHSLCVRILRQYGQLAGINGNFSIYDEADQRRCAKHAVERAKLDGKQFAAAKVLEYISKLKNDLVSPEDFAGSADDYFRKCIARIYSHYQAVLAENNALDFDDLLVKTAYLLRDHRMVMEELNNRFRYLLVDEYQDTNHAQYQIARGMSLLHGNICVTGDPDQSIYAWRGADIGNILEFELDWPNAKVVRLEENFRSTPNILGVADKLISFNTERKIKKLVPVIQKGCDVETGVFEDEQAESESVADGIANLLKNGTSPAEIAVFYRVNSMSRMLEEALVLRQIPYQIVRGIEFYNRKEIKDLLAYLRLIANPADNGAFLRIVNEPARGIGKISLERLEIFASKHKMSLYSAVEKIDKIENLGPAVRLKLRAFAAMIEKFKQMTKKPVAELMEHVFQQSGLVDGLEREDSQGHSKASAVENVEELISSARKYDELAKDTPQAGLVDYLQQIALYSDTDAYDPSSPKVSLMTLHAAKGLEFDNVFIVGLEEGLLPHQRSANDNRSLEEERRLFFVGITRARKSLAVSMCRYRTIHGISARTIPSRFLFEAGLKVRDSEKRQVENKINDFKYDDADSQICEYDDSQERLFVKNELVSHQKFGLGRVQEFHNLGENSIVVVRFISGKTKPLMLKYTNLTKVR